MEETDHTTACRLTITVDDVALPVDQQVRRSVLDHLGLQVRDLLEKRHSLTVNQDEITVATGYCYAQVPASCPLCGESLDLLSVHLDDSNGAFASTMCHTDNCDWSGDAVYRIIDLEGSETSAFESSVLTGHITPSYHPY